MRKQLLPRTGQER